MHGQFHVTLDDQSWAWIYLAVFMAGACAFAERGARPIGFQGRPMAHHIAFPCEHATQDLVVRIGPHL